MRAPGIVSKSAVTVTRVIAVMLIAALSLPITGCQKSAAPLNPSPVLEKVGVEYAYPHFSHDSKRILLQSNESGFWRLCVLNLQDKTVDFLTPDSLNNYFPDWSPDNSRICFVSDRTGNEEVYVMNTDGSDVLQITSNGARNIHPYWSPDGTRILFSSTVASDDLELFQMNADGSDVRRITNTEDHETCARFAPGGDRILYLRNNETGFDDIFVMSIADSTASNLTNTPVSDGWPTWMPDGDAVVYASVQGDQFKLFRHSLTDDSVTRLTDPPAGSDDCRANVAQDGKEIVFNRQTDTEAGRTNAIWILKL